MIIDWKGESWEQGPDPGLVREDDGTPSAGEQEKTKVIVRHLPPSLSEKSFLEQIQPGFAGVYNWVSFHQGKSSYKRHLYSWAHINFNCPQDVFVFFEAFNGHVFVNEKGSQFKVLVEYAPYQRIPKASTKDVEEGSIMKDPEFLEFAEFVAKPVEKLPSAEVQFERREAEKAAGRKEAVIVTPLMEFVRQKRASKAEQQRLHHVSGMANARGYGNLITNGPRSMANGSSRFIPMYILKSGTELNEKPDYAPHRGKDTGKDKGKDTNIIGEKKCTKQLTRRGCALQQEVKEDDGLLSVAEVIKPAKGGCRVVSCGSHERQVWVAKPTSGI